MSVEFPMQKVSISMKTKKWYEESTKSGIEIVLNEENSIKPTTQSIDENLAIYDGERDTSEMIKSYDPLQSINPKYKPKFKTFSTIRNRIDELVGEYNESGFDYMIAALDRDAVNKKIQENKARIQAEVNKLISTDEELSQEDIQNKLSKIATFRFMSGAEVTANKVLNYYKTRNRLRYKELEGFRHALITATVAFSVYIENKTLKVDLHNPNKVFAVRNGDSNNLKDSDMLAFVDFLPKGKIIDKYGEYLKDSDVKKIINYEKTLNSSAETEARNSLVIKTHADAEAIRPTNLGYSSPDVRTMMDDRGNIRVVKFYWKGYRKIFKRKYYDENGTTQFDFVSEKAIPNIDKGEVFTAVWKTEWHQAIQIGKDLIVNAKIMDYQYTNVKNPKINLSGVVGGYFNVGDRRAKSMIDNVKSYLIFRDTLFARIEDLLSKNIGKIIEIDIARKPAKWSVTKVLTYLKKYNILVTNSFNEGTKGKAMGKLAGQYTQGVGVRDAELGSSISYIIQLLGVVDNMIAKVTGVTDQKLGAIQARELVGNVNSSKSQSSLVTEIWFIRYEQIILDLYHTIIEVSKRAIDVDDGLQFILSDMSYSMLKGGLDEFKNTEIGLFPTNSRKYDKLKGIIEQISLNAVPNGQMTMSELASIYTSGSVPEMLDKQEEFDNKKQEAQREIQKLQDAARDKERKLIQEHEKFVAQLNFTFDAKLEKIKGDFDVLITSMKLKDNAISEHIKAVSDVNAASIQKDYNDKKLELEGSKIEASKKVSEIV